MAHKNKIMFETVRAEMARRFITIQEMADTLGCTRDTLSNKLSGKTMINLNEAIVLNLERRKEKLNKLGLAV